MDKSTRKALKIINDIDDNNLNNDVDSVRIVNPNVELKENLYNFFINRLKKVEEQEDFKDRVKEAILEKIEGDKISVGQLITLFKTIYNETTLSVDSLLSVFKNNNGNAVIFNDVGNNNNEESEEDMDLDSTDSEKIDKLYRIITEISQNSDEDSE